MKPISIITISLLLFLVLISLGIIFLYNNYLYPLNYKNEILAYSEKYDVEPYLIASIINSESKFNKKAISSKGAVGLMQIMPKTGQWVIEKISGEILELNVIYDKNSNSGILLNAEDNIKIGTYYLSYLLKKFSDLNVAICAYNAGEGTVAGWLKNKNYSADGKTLDFIPYQETQLYLNKVKKNINIYITKF